MEAQHEPLLLSIFLAALLFQHQVIPTIGSETDPTTPTPTNGSDYIRTRCVSTLYPDICYASLSRFAHAIQQDPAQLARVSLSVSLSKARFMAIYLSNLSRQADYGASDPRTVLAVHDCFTNFGDAVDGIRGSLKQMRQLGTGETLRFQMSNVQTWMSAALTDEDTCTDGFQEVGDGPVKSDVCGRVGKVRKYTSNALALVNSYFEIETHS